MIHGGEIGPGDKIEQSVITARSGRLDEVMHASTVLEMFLRGMLVAIPTRNSPTTRFAQRSGNCAGKQRGSAQRASLVFPKSTSIFVPSLKHARNGCHPRFGCSGCGGLSPSMLQVTLPATTDNARVTI